MRISQALISNIVRHGAERAARALIEAQAPLQNGTSLAAPSADMVRANRASVLDQFDRELARYEQARAQVRGDFVNAELALSGIHDVVVQAQELAVQMGSDTLNDGERRDSAVNAQRLLQQLASLANRTDPAGKYLFTGEAEDAPPLAADFTYQGDDAVRMVEVGPGVLVPATLSGREVLGPGNEVISTLQNLVRALEGGSADAVRATLDDLASARERVSGVWADVGGRMSMLDGLADLTVELRTNVQIERGTLAGVDLAQVAPAMQSAQTVLEAVLMTSQRILAQVGSGWFQ